jgi:hypothetical protein
MQAARQIIGYSLYLALTSADRRRAAATEHGGLPLLAQPASDALARNSPGHDPSIPSMSPEHCPYAWQYRGSWSGETEVYAKRCNLLCGDATRLNQRQTATVGDQRYEPL